MEFEPTLSPRFMVYIRDYLMDYGIDPVPVLEDVGFSINAEEESDPPLPLSKVAQLFELSARLTGEDFIGMRLAQRYHYESAGLMILLMLAAPSVEEGIRTLCRYDRYVDTAIEAAFEAGPEVSTFSVTLIDSKGSRLDQLMEFLITFFIDILNKATRKPVPITEVWLSHANRGRNPKPLEDFLNSPVLFERPANRIFFSSSYLQERFFTSNSLLFEVLTNAFKTYFFSRNKSNGFIEVVCREIVRAHGEENPSLGSIASRLAMSERTLRRRLAEEGYSFQEVKNIAREERAKYFLANTAMPLVEIGYKLGYSELSAFSRAFRSWAGESPQIYREKVRKMISG